VHVTTTPSYAAVATQAWGAAEKSVAAFTLATKPLTVASNEDGDLPKAFTEPVQRYLQYVQQAAQVNVELATTWTQLVAAFSGVPAVRVAKVSAAAQHTVETVSDAATSVVEATVPDQLDEVSQADVELAREAERAEAKHAHELAREPYRSLTKAELSALLAERGLPKTGTVGVLIDRLVAADSGS
jgi:hypothetical protein